MEQNETAKHINRKKEKIHTIDVIIISSTDVTLLGHGFIANSFRRSILIHSKKDAV